MAVDKDVSYEIVEAGHYFIYVGHNLKRIRYLATLQCGRSQSLMPMLVSQVHVQHNSLARSLLLTELISRPSQHDN